ncbi:MAG: hypothetical protein QOD07_2059 [Frankiaceae bacterium]|jgi:hypothetical protein|nr:hypothetical protein [Frankiaceae bacterium]
MPGTTGDELPSVGFIARYLADAAKQHLPARGVVTVLQSYLDRGLPCELVRQAVELARNEVGRDVHSLLEEYGAQVHGGPTTA